jgi:hypothetical protein
MKKSEFFNIGLPKWPAFVVMGKPVTADQAIKQAHRSINKEAYEILGC